MKHPDNAIMKTVQRLLIATLIVTATACSKEGPTAASGPAPKVTQASGHAAQANTAAMSPEVAAQAGVETLEAAPAVIRTSLTLFGNVQPEPQNVAMIAARYPGVIRSIAHRLGDRVRAGDPLAKVESNESLQVYSVVAPISGVITQRHANPGEVAGSGALFEIVDASKVRVDLSVFPQDRGKLRVGQKVLVSSTDSSTEGEGTLTFISPLGSAQTQSVTARVSLDNAEGRWTPGQFVTADVLLDESRAGVAVAPTALQQVKGESVVFVQTEHGFEARRVETGRRSEEAVEIRKGLEAGERYAAKNTFVLKAELLKSEAE